MKRAHVFVSGRVQGVFFRDSTVDKARELGVHGWVRNLRDGRVEAVYEGPDDAVEKLLDWTHEGPRDARVDEVQVEWQDPEGLAAFERRPTAEARAKAA